MSSTGRSNVRDEKDYYPTPPWCTHRLLDTGALDDVGENWFEPCAGSGAMIRAANEGLLGRGQPHPRWVANEPFPGTSPVTLSDGSTGLTDKQRLLSEVKLGPRPGKVTLQDFLSYELGPAGKKHDVILTNPPYRLAMPIIEHALEVAHVVAMLLRINFLASESRSAFMASTAPDVYVLPNRPSFLANGRTDSTEYAWFVWGYPRARTSGRWQVLGVTPAEARRSQRGPHV